MKSNQMTHWERMNAALAGKETDRAPISLWRHWPAADEHPQKLAAAMIRWQRAYKFDLLKFMPTGTYSIEDWGAETKYIPNGQGTRTVIRHGVTSVDQWPALEKLDATSGYFGHQITALRLTAEALKNRAPILQTVFSPLTTALKLAGDRIFADLRRHPDTFKAGLKIITETTIQFAVESIRAGACGVFFASQCDTYRLLTEAEYREFGEAFDLAVLNAIRPETTFNLVHAHGEDIMFDLMAGYPVEAINWHDRLTAPSLRAAGQRFSGLLVGGINEHDTLQNGPFEAIQAEIADAISQTNGRRLMIGPGCVIPIDTPEAHIRAARAAVGRVSK